MRCRGPGSPFTGRGAHRAQPDAQPPSETRLGPPALRQAPTRRAPCCTVRAEDPLGWVPSKPGDSGRGESAPSRPLSNQSRAWPLPVRLHTVCFQKRWAAGLHQATHFTSLNPVLLLCKEVGLTLVSE